MIKAIIFDFDGVIIESAEIKTRAFALLFAQYPEKIKEIIEYHTANGGISRYVKFRYIYQNILGQDLSEGKERELGEQFSSIVLEQVMSAPYVPGTPEFLESNKGNYQLFIASGTPLQELKEIVSNRNLGGFFQEVRGTPDTKSEIIEDILSRYHLHRNEVAFIGDAVSDRNAAKQTKVNFIARITLESQLDDCHWKIDDLTELDTVLKTIKKEGLGS